MIRHYLRLKLTSEDWDLIAERVIVALACVVLVAFACGWPA